MQEIAYFNGSEDFFSELSDYLKGKEVLEIFAGNGLLARKLADRGVKIKATSLFSGHDGHDLGMHFSVDQMDARKAIQVYGDQSDVLLVSWPVADNSILRALEFWKSEKPIVYIGEAPNPDLPGMAFLPGCACDEFFERITWLKEFETYQPKNLIEKAGVVYLKEAS